MGDRPATTTPNPVAPKPADLPRSAVISGCIVDGKSTVFFTDKFEILKTLQNLNEKDVEALGAKGREAYSERLLKLNGENVKSLTRDIAAVSFPLSTPSITRSRLYYIDDKSTLQELQKEGTDPWKKGQLGDDLKNVTVKKHSPITAFLSVNSDSIKVYYYKDDSDKPYVAFWDGATKKWATEFTG